jgi:carboxypeptidase family protein/TonB-dependent receptor-like protein
MAVTTMFRVGSMSGSARGLRSCFGVMFLILFLSSLALAQRDLGTITGTVTDPSGGVVAGAMVTITEDATGQSYVIETSRNGDFTRPALLPGTYTVTVEAPGFRGVSQHNIEVTAGSRIGVNLTLQVGSVSESVAVTAEAPLIQSESTQLGAQLNTTQVEDLPLGGPRVFTDLARLTPGVVPGESNRDQNTGDMSVNGVRALGQNNFLLNGVDNNVNVIDFLNGAAFVIGPPPEAIGEMQVLTSGYNAEYGRAAGGVINVNLKNGTNQIHGGLWEVLQNEDLNANSWQNNTVGAPKPEFRQNQFGAAAGGPIIRNRLFIFGDYQGTRITDVAQSGFLTIPTPAEIRGDFSADLGGQIGTDALGRPILGGQIYDPNTTTTVNGQLVRNPFPGNIIPASRFDPAAAKVLALFPAPNQPLLAGGFPKNDYYYVSPGTNPTDSGDVRVDYHMSEKNTFYGSYSMNDTNNTSAAELPLPLAQPPVSGGQFQPTETKFTQAGFTRVWSPTIVSETRFGVTRLTTAISSPADTGPDLYKQFGIGGYDPSSQLSNGNNGLPGVSVDDGTPYSAFGAGGWQPMIMHSNVEDFIQNVAISKGAHAYKFGFEFRQINYPFVQFSDPHGDFTVSRNATAYPSETNSLNAMTGDPMASFLLGILDSGSISTLNQIKSAKHTYAGYAQDDWKVSRNLTLNLGIRYELFSPTYATDGRQSNFDFNNATLYIPPGPDQNAPLPPNFATSYPNITVSRGAVSKYMFPWDKTDFGPRIGLAYKFQAKTVFRAGFGIFYGGEENLGGNPNLGEGPPFNTTITLNNPNTFGTNPYLAGGFSAGWPTSVFDTPAQIGFRGIATDFRSPMVKKWNFALQHEFPGNVSLEVAYIGNDQTHQIELHTGNACPDSGSAAAIANPNAWCNANRPIANIGPGNIVDTFGRANYNALSVKVEKRLSYGLEFISAYTWSHTLSDACTPLTAPFGCGGGFNGYEGAPNPLNQNSGYANALWDIRDNFTTGFTYQLPLGKGRTYAANVNPVVDGVIGGWALGGILTIRTGVPLTLGYNGCQGVWAYCTPEIQSGMCANCAPTGGRTAGQWFNTAAVGPAAPGTGGDAGIFNITAPGTSTLDASLFKNFSITERFRLEFRLEAFNALNKTQLGTPDTNLQDATFGKITTSNNSRRAQVSLRLHF